MPGERQADIMKAKTEDRLQKGALHMRAITYSRQGDYLLPDLTVPDGPEVHLGKYASLRQTYLKEHRYGIYLNLLTTGRLSSHLNEVQREDAGRMEVLTGQMKQPGAWTEGTESERPDGVGTADEQHPAGSGRDRDERADLQLTGQEPQSEEERQEPTAEPQPTVAEQQTFLEELAGEESPAFSMPQEIIDHALQMGSSFEHGKYRIYSYFLQGHSNKERADFLKQEYGIWGSGSDYLGEKFNRGTVQKGILSNGKTMKLP